MSGSASAARTRGRLIVVVGATGTGKSALALDLAERLDDLFAHLEEAEEGIPT